MASKAGAFAPQLRLAAQRHVDHAPLAAVHRIEEKWRAGVLDFFGRGRGAQTQLLDAQHAVIVGVE
jgi:hypothetical protein